MTGARLPDSILILSGGIDSTTTLAELTDRGLRPLCLIFNYGQTLSKEVDVAVANAQRYGAAHHVVDLQMGWIAPGCALLGGAEIPTGRTRKQIGADGTPPTYVPFRNGIMLSIAAAAAEARRIRPIYCGGNGLDSGNYWDDTFEFAKAMEKAIDAGTDPKWQSRVLFPNANRTKVDVVTIGLTHGVDYSKTWSCYKNDDLHCGECDSCVQRREALAAHGLNIEGESL